MKSKIIVTADNSKTLLIPELNETYHSTKGALTEALHVFIKEGLHYSGKTKLSIFEMGFGTGLNALLTLDESNQNNLKIDYQCIEAFPLRIETVNEMDYLQISDLTHLDKEYHLMHSLHHEQEEKITENFTFKKYLSKIQEQELPKDQFDIIYYDAFGPKVQEELWQEQVLEKIVNSIKTNGLLVTYCAQGAFKRTLKKLGLTVESIPGPPGKREMTRAFKNF